MTQNDSQPLLISLFNKSQKLKRQNGVKAEKRRAWAYYFCFEINKTIITLKRSNKLI